MNYRVFLWENGGRSTEYTQYMVAPFFFKDNLDETLDEGEIILDSMPIETKLAFPPKTKFRVERYLNADFSGTPDKIYDLVVEYDDVEECVGTPDICTHRINCIEASVIAQGMHVDNIALTYELQDVTLNYKTTISDETAVTVNGNGNGIGGGLETGIRTTQDIEYTTYIIGGGGGGGNA